MTRVSLTEDYDDRSVIAKLKRMDEKLDADAGIVTRAEESARASAESAQATADRFAGAVGDIVSDAKGEIAEAKAEVTSARRAVDETVTTVAQAVTTANSASASARQSAQTVQGFEDRLRRAEVDIQTLDGETADLYAKDAMNLKSDEPNQTAQGLKVGTHDLSKAVTTDEAQVITGAKTIVTRPVTDDSEALVIRSQRSSGQTGMLYSLPMEFSDGPEFGSLYSYKGSSQTSNVLKVTRGSRNAEIAVISNDTAGEYAIAPTPADSAPSNAVTTKAYVESTDGTTNNLVHRTANETIEGYKRFTGGAIGYIGYHTRNTGTTKIVLCDTQALSMPQAGKTGRITVYAHINTRYGMFDGSIIFDIDASGTVVLTKVEGLRFGNDTHTYAYIYRIPATTSYRVAIGNNDSSNNHFVLNCYGGMADAAYDLGALDFSRTGTDVTSEITDSTTRILLIGSV